MTNIYSNKSLLSNYRNPSDTVFFYTRITRKTLKSAISRDKQRHYGNYKLVHDILLLPDIMKRRISDVEIMETEALMQIMSSRIRRSWWNSPSIILHRTITAYLHADMVLTPWTPPTAAKSVTIIFDRYRNDFYPIFALLPLLLSSQPPFYAISRSSPAAPRHTDQCGESEPTFDNDTLSMAPAEHLP